MIYPRAIEVRPLPNYILSVTFNNGERRRFDVKPYIRGEWFSELLDVDTFNAVKIDGLSVSWPDGQDIAPDCLYSNASNDLTDEERAIITNGREEYKTGAYTPLDRL